MGRLARRLFTIASVLSLVLCVVTVVLWVRSCRYLERLAVQRPDGRLYEVNWFVGGVTLSVTSGCDPRTGWSGPSFDSSPIEETANHKLNSWPTWEAGGFGVSRYRSDWMDAAGINLPNRCLTTDVRLPFWAAVSASLIIPAAAGLRYLRQCRHTASGLCRAAATTSAAPPAAAPSGLAPAGR